MASECDQHAVQYLQSQYKDDVQCVYRLSYASNIHRSQIEYICLLTSVIKCPQKHYTQALFDDSDVFNNIKIRYHFLEQANFFDRDQFSRNSLHNYTWLLRILHHSPASVCIFGIDIRDQIPFPEYPSLDMSLEDFLASDYADLILRCFYELARSMDRNKPQVDRLIKGTFYLGYLLIALQNPELNCQLYDEIYQQLQQYAVDGLIYMKTFTLFEKITAGIKPTFTDFLQLRIDCIEAAINEISLHGISIDRLKLLLQRGFGDSDSGEHFGKVLVTIDRMEKIKGKK